MDVHYVVELLTFRITGESGMPIYEFKCMKCEAFVEILIMNKDEAVEMVCPECSAQRLERVLSTTHFSMKPGASSGTSGVSSQTRTCSGGSCTTYDIPGPNG